MNHRTAIVSLGLLCVLLWNQTLGKAAQNKSPYRVGLARACITPEESLWLAGYRSRKKPSQGVLDDLYVHALAFEDAGGRRALLLAVDLCVLRTATVNRLCRKITERTGLTREQVLVNLSHTHSGPAVDLLDMGYPLSPEGRKKLEAYTHKVTARMVELAQAALEDLAPAELAFGTGTATFFENRRRLNDEGRYVGMGPNPQNHTDREVPVLRISNPDGKVRALVFGAACHNVTLGGNSYKVSGDYSGAARAYLESQLPGVQTVFVTGCGADANPAPRSTADEEAWVARHGESLGAEVLKVLSGPMRPITGPLKTALAFVDLPLSAPPSRSELEELRKGPNWKSHVAKLMLAAQDRGATIPTTYSAPIAVWHWGDCLTLVGLPEETVSEYVPLLKRALGTADLWTAGYCNDVSGYLPTAKILGEGGYETRGLFGPEAGWFAPQAEEEVVNAVCRLARQVGRLPPTKSHAPAKPISWWRFEPKAMLANTSGRADQLLSRHGPVDVCEPAPVPDSQAGVSLNGASYLEGGAPELPNAGQDGLTVAAWVRPSQSGLSGSRMIVCQWANKVGDDRFCLFLADGKPGMAVADGLRGERGFAGRTVLQADRWYFLAGTWDAVSRRYRMYVDGHPEPNVGYQAGVGINGSSRTSLKIGAEAAPGNERYFAGQIDEVMLFDVALDETQIGRLSQGKLNGRQ